MKILFMEKKEFIGHMFTMAFSENGYDITLVNNTHDALCLIVSFWFDIIMIDTTNSGIEGLEFLSIIDGAESEFETVLFTADEDIDIRLDILKFNAEGHITSPMRSDAMSIILEKVFKKHGATTATLKVCTRCCRNCSHNNDISSPPMT